MGISWSALGLHLTLDPLQADQISTERSAPDDDFWDAFDDAEDWAANRPTPWYRRAAGIFAALFVFCLLYTSPSPRDATLSRMPSSA